MILKYIPDDLLILQDQLLFMYDPQGPERTVVQDDDATHLLKVSYIERFEMKGYHEMIDRICSEYNKYYLAPTYGAHIFSNDLEAIKN